VIIMKLNNKVNTSIKKDNKGAALIVCIIILLFVSILATVILYMSGINFRMKKAEYHTKIAFYGGEETLERMQSNLVVPVSEAYNLAYTTTNTHYTDLGSPDARRAFFYNEFYKELQTILVENYSGGAGNTTSIGLDGSSVTDSYLIKYMLHNLTYSDGSNTPYNGVAVNDIYCNGDAALSSYSNPSYSNNPMAFVNTLMSVREADGTSTYFPGNADGSPRVYIVVSSYLDNGTANANYQSFVQLSTDSVQPQTPNQANPSLLKEGKECRLLFKNICVVMVQDGYTSVIKTDLAVQLPPVDWNGGMHTTEYTNWDVYELFYYVNWQKS